MSTTGAGVCHSHAHFFPPAFFLVRFHFFFIFLFSLPNFANCIFCARVPFLFFPPWKSGAGRPFSHILSTRPLPRVHRQWSVSPPRNNSSSKWDDLLVTLALKAEATSLDERQWGFYWRDMYNLNRPTLWIKCKDMEGPAPPICPLEAGT